MKGWQTCLLIVAGLIVVLAIAVGVAVWLLFRPAPVPPPIRERVTVVKPTAQSPEQVVVGYLGALEKQDWRAAYSYLSAASQRKHPYAEFARLCETKGMTEYDLKTAKVEQGREGYMTVAVQLKEDVATAGFRLEKEGGGWKVVFIGGIPSYPYP